MEKRKESVNKEILEEEYRLGEKYYEKIIEKAKEEEISKYE